MEPLPTPDDGNTFPYGASSPNVEDSLVLKNFVGEDSWGFFEMLKISHEFLPLPVQEWKFDEGYKGGKLVEQNLEFVNDTAERGVN